MKLLGVFLLFLVCSCASRKTLDFEVPRYSWKELVEAGVVIQAAVDADQPEAAWCGLSSTEAMKMSQPLKQHLDEQRERIEKKARSEWPALPAESKNCRENCSCGALWDLWGMHEEELSAQEQKMLSEILLIAEGQSEREVQACARRVKNFCESSLLKELKKDAEEFNGL